jgi:hypothetical protein
VRSRGQKRTKEAVGWEVRKKTKEGRRGTQNETKSQVANTGSFPFCVCGGVSSISVHLLELALWYE